MRSSWFGLLWPKYLECMMDLQNNRTDETIRLRV